jgi:alkanesulfonate monooxygenase SsuD/methylene tetrahydromethanopterin reductase-like flavin-dependent oxidoreductase (luciferase family)
VRFGLLGGPAADADRLEHSYHHFAQYAVEAEALGFAAAFLTEHHFTGLGQASSPLTLLAHLAARTSSLRLRLAVAVLPCHDQLLLAAPAATVDVLSRGRWDFGVGRGFRAAEFAGFMQPMDDAPAVFRGTRPDPPRLDDDGRWSHEGRSWRYADVLVERRTVQRPHPPIWSAQAAPVH